MLLHVLSYLSTDTVKYTYLHNIWQLFLLEELQLLFFRCV